MTILQQSWTVICAPDGLQLTNQFKKYHRSNSVYYSYAAASECIKSREITIHCEE